MSLSKFHIKVTFLLLLSLLPLVLYSKTIPLGNQISNNTLSLKPYWSIFEDIDGKYTADKLFLDSTGFVPLSQFKITRPESIFWLRAEIETSNNLNQLNFSITFNHLTFVDLYLYNPDGSFIHKQNGAFRKQQFISPEDNRFTFNLTLEPGTSYTLLLKVEHVKKYPPNFDFVLENTLLSLSSKYNYNLINAFLLGAIVILVCYTIMLWLINRYRPHLWLLLFLLGIGLYSFALRPFFIDTLFPQYPKVGWLLIFPFLHLGVIGFYLLMIDFLEMRKNAPVFYIYSQYLVKVLIVFSCLSLLYNTLTANYYLTNKINLYLAPIHLFYVVYILILLGKKLTSAQRYFVYGVFLFGFAVVFFTISSFLFNEQSLIIFPIVAKFTILCISLLFLVGLHKQLQQHEQEKLVALQQLNDIQLQYSTTIKKKVKERTLKLKNTNAKLVEQQVQLIEKNRHIEILMDELNHRVKNNLQMLYSLNTLQIPLIKDVKSKQILNEMLGRIKAIMVVNDHLHAYKKDQPVTLSFFINEISNHLQQIYDPNKHIKIITVIPEDCQFSALEALPFGLLLTELFTNTYKHAFPLFHFQPQIKLSLFIIDQKLQFIFKDNGQGAQHYIHTTTMGISIIQDLTRQLKGTVSIEHENGFSYRFIFSNANQYANINH